MKIYVITAGANLTKIGVAESPPSRMKSLQSASHAELQLVHVSAAMAPLVAHAVERTAHHLLVEQRAQGEWFNVGAVVAVDAISKAIDLVEAGFDHRILKNIKSFVGPPPPPPPPVRPYWPLVVQPRQAPILINRSGATTRAALYLRVSTDRQTTENQAARLEEVARHRGWEVVQTYQDAGISGAKGRDKRPALDKMLKDASRRKYDVLMVWAIDRLGRSLIDLLGSLQTLNECRVNLYCDQQALDTTTPAGRAMFQMIGVFAEFERSIISERVKAGVARARANGNLPGRKVDPAKVAEALDMLAEGIGIGRVRQATGLGTGKIAKLKREMGAAMPPVPGDTLTAAE